eukprot:11882346-Heterocapsa_arctica.AAC.1
MATPVVNDTTIDETDKLDYDMKKIYGTVNGIMQFMLKFRPDAHYAIKEIGRKNHEPTEANLRKMKRCV